MAYKIEDIEGIGKKFGVQLRKVKIQSTNAILKRLGDKKGRVAVAKETGISAKLLLEWANHADLMRITGIGPDFADLLEEAGVDSVKELSKRKGPNLTEALVKKNKIKKLTSQVPNVAMVEKWVSQAKKLKPAVSH